MIGTIYAGKSIGDKKIAKEFFLILKREGFLPDKIGTYEPLKEEYSDERAIEIWVDYNKGYNQFAGSIIGKRKSPSFRFDMLWAKGPKALPNYIHFFFSNKTLKDNKEKILKIFKEVFILFEGIYGYITEDEPEMRQHVKGTIETRLPGVFWCNFYGKVYVDFFGKERLESFPWTEVEELENETIVTFLTTDPKLLKKSDELEVKAKEYLGTEFFGDLDLYEKNPFETQIRKVPKLNLPDVKVMLE